MVVEFEEADEGDCRVIRLVGEVDLAVVDDLRGRGRSGLAARDAVRLDLSRLQFIDSSGLAVLVTLHKEAHAAGKSFALTDPSPTVRRLLAMTGLDHLFDVHPSAT